MAFSRQKLCWIWLSLIDGLSLKRFYQLLAKFDEPEAIFDAVSSEGMRFIGEDVLNAMHKARDMARVNEVIARMEELGGEIITRLDYAYPALLNEVFDPPAVLYTLGEKPWLHGDCFAIVGTRRPTPYGLRAAGEIAREITRAKLCVVSGLARGIDAAAHKGAVEAHGATIAVQGCGIDIVYPYENRKLRDEILSNGGAVISEYPPGMRPTSFSFPARNRIITGLSRGALIVEAQKKSGAMITARLAEEQNRDVFAVPGGPYALESQGPLDLIKNGAKLTTCARDILEEYGLTAPKIEEQFEDAQLEPYELKVLNHLRTRIMTFDEIIESTKFTAGKCNSLLTSMELRGIIRQTPGRQYMALK